MSSSQPAERDDVARTDPHGTDPHGTDPHGSDPDGSDPDLLVRLRPADAGELMTLQRAAYVTEAQLHDDVHLPPLAEPLEHLRAELAGPSVVAWGLRRGHRLVAAVRLRDLGNGGVELGRLVVAPDCQGHGLGTRLLLDAERCLPPGTSTVHLFTGERSEANLRLYRRHGYVETHRTPAGAYALVHLVKQLP